MPSALCAALAFMTLAAPVVGTAGQSRAAPREEIRAVSPARIAAIAVAQPQDARALPTQRDQTQRLAQLEGRWRLAFWAIVGLSLVLAVMGAVAAIAQRRARGALHFARSMAHELEERRRVGLAERQQTARRIVELEDRVRQLEGQVRDPGHSMSRRA